MAEGGVTDFEAALASAGPKCGNLPPIHSPGACEKLFRNEESWRDKGYRHEADQNPHPLGKGGRTF